MVLSLPQGLAILYGPMLLATLGSKIKYWQWQLTGSVFIMVLFGSLLALVSQTNKGLMVAFVFLSQSGYSYAIYLSIAIAQMGVEHRNLGLSGGIAGAFRFAAGSSMYTIGRIIICLLTIYIVGAAVYTTILTNKTNKWIARLVPPAAIAAGLPTSSVPNLMKVVGTSALAKSFSPNVVAATGSAVGEACTR
jgi:hypothetical protein